MHCPVNFPSWYYIIAKPFRKMLASKVGGFIRMNPLPNANFYNEGVNVLRLSMKKYKPHSAYAKSEINKFVQGVVKYCKKTDFEPDVISGHWLMPCFDIIPKLKKRLGNKAKTCLILHDSGTRYLGRVYKEWTGTMQTYDVLGFRSDAIKLSFEKTFGVCKKDNFMCYSGIPEAMAMTPLRERNWDKVARFLYVGELIERKYPTVVATALNKTYPDGGFSINYIGTGYEEKKIEKIVKVSNNKNIHLMGMIPREEVFKKMEEADVFVMISREETFGLVYLEAMAQGCITIASKEEGFDGIIKDGVNGFLCKAGDESNLIEIFRKIQNMPVEERKRISLAAKTTATELTDKKVARMYVKHLAKH